eukprot:4049172-Pleurochrysis_carterae.AAC.2
MACLARIQARHCARAALFFSGEVVERLAPVELPVHTLTAAQVEEARRSADATACATAAACASAAATAEAASGKAAAHRSGTLGSAGGDRPGDAARLRGNVAFGAGHFDEALAAYCEALTLEPDNGLLYGNRSAAYLHLKRPADAVADAEKMVALLPDAPKAYFRLASAYEKSADFPQARDTASHAFQPRKIIFCIVKSLQEGAIASWRVESGYAASFLSLSKRLTSSALRSYTTGGRVLRPSAHARRDQRARRGGRPARDGRWQVEKGGKARQSGANLYGGARSQQGLRQGQQPKGHRSCR